MPRLTQSEIHSDFSTASGTWTGYRAEVTGFYNDYPNSELDAHISREYNRKVNSLGQAKSLYIAPYDAGFSYVGNGSDFVNILQAAKGAFSLRSLNSRRDPFVVNVRRDSDNSVKDFKASEITDGTLTTWVGNNNGFVTVWYNQAGQGDAIQTTSSFQPKIVNSGSLIEVNGKPSIHYTSSYHVLVASIKDFQSITNLSTFCVQTPTSAATANSNTMRTFLFGWGAGIEKYVALNSSTGLLSGETITVYFGAGDNRRYGSDSYTRASATQSLIEMFNTQNGISVYSQGDQITLNLLYNGALTDATSPSDTTYTDDNNVSINNVKNNSGNYTSAPNSKFQELIFFDENRISDRAIVADNLNNFYSIY